MTHQMSVLIPDPVSLHQKPELQIKLKSRRSSTKSMINLTRLQTILRKLVPFCFIKTMIWTISGSIGKYHPRVKPPNFNRRFSNVQISISRILQLLFQNRDRMKPTPWSFLMAKSYLDCKSLMTSHRWTKPKCHKHQRTRRELSNRKDLS